MSYVDLTLHSRGGQIQELSSDEIALVSGGLTMYAEDDMFEYFALDDSEFDSFSGFGTGLPSWMEDFGRDPPERPRLPPPPPPPPPKPDGTLKKVVRKLKGPARVVGEIALAIGAQELIDWIFG